MAYYLGIIGMASISRIAIASETGKILNWCSFPPLILRNSIDIQSELWRNIKYLTTSINIPIEVLFGNLGGICLSISGLYLESDIATLRQMIFQLGIPLETPLVVCEGCRAQLASNFLSIGGIVRASTGAVVFLQGPNPEQTIQVDGWGSILGDDGSGYFLGMECLHALFKAHDGRIRRSILLEEMVMQHVGLSRSVYHLDELAQWVLDVSQTHNWRLAISSLATPLIAAAEEHNDALSQRIVNNGVDSVVNSLQTAKRIAIQKWKLLQPLSLPLITRGGLYKNSTIYRDRFNLRVIELNKKNKKISFEIIQPLYPSIIGALALAISGNEHIDKDLEKYDVLKESANLSNLSRMSYQSFENE